MKQLIGGGSGSVGSVGPAVPAGTAAAPSIAFEGDSNTGIYSPGADQLAISTNGTGRLFVDASGNVALGSATFLKPFTIINQNAAISLRANSSGTYSDQGIFFAVDGTNYAQIYNESDGQLIFRTGSGLSERMRIDSAGRLLVGTSTNTGANLLQVNSDALVNGLTVGRGTSAISSNTALGVQALYSNTTGSYNTANGISALYSNTTGGNNTANGVQAGSGVGTNSNTTGSNNTFIGNESVGASSTANNVITLGNGAIATLRAQVTTITALSDERDKKNIVPLNAGLDFLTKLRPVSFTWNTRDKAKVDVEDTGFIAQELLAVQEDTGITIPNLVSQENPDKLEAGYGTLIPVLVSAVQELTAMVKQLQDEIITLKGDN